MEKRKKVQNVMFESRPDQEGIKTLDFRYVVVILLFESRPDQEGIKTPSPLKFLIMAYLFESRPDQEGIKTEFFFEIFDRVHSLNRDLIKKGLRHRTLARGFAELSV